MPTVVSSSKRNRSKKLDSDQELISTSLKRFKIAGDAESESRKAGLEDLQFSIGTGQWDAAVKSDREIEGRPCLTMNHIPTALRQLTGDQRQNRPAMIVSPVRDGANEDTAEIIQGVLRHLEVVSDADLIYDYCYDMMLRIGWSDWAITPRYVSDKSFDQEPRLELVENPFMLYMSPIRNTIGQDPLWCHCVQDMSKDEYKEQFGKLKNDDDNPMVKLDFPTNWGNAEPDWVTKDGVRIAEYWWLELKRRVLCLMPDGTTAYWDELAKDLRDHVENKRDVVSRTVRFVKHDAMQVLEEYDYPGTIIPKVELSGVRLNVDGKIFRAGMVRDARDAQRSYDFHVTQAVEQVNLYGKDPLFVAEGSIVNHEEEYRQVNRKNYPYLYYQATGSDGKPLPPPQRAGRETPIQALTALIQQADYDMKSIMGIYGTGAGEEPNQNESAFSVLTRQAKTDTGTINWSDNLSRAITYSGKILLDIFPKLIGAARLQRYFTGEDEVKHAVVFNSQMSSPEDAQALLFQQQGLNQVYDLGVGDYDVVISAGPQYRTARQEAFRALGAIIGQQPNLAPMLMDVWVKYGDFPGAHVLADRFKKMLPPQLQDQGDPGNQVTQLQSTIAQMSAQHNQLVAELNRASDTIRTKRLELESKERIASQNNQTNLVLEQVKQHGAAANAQLQAQLDAITQRLDALHSSMSVEQEAGQPLNTPELPSAVEPTAQRVTPSQPTPRPQPIQGAL